jgi:hypothetical protein
MVAADAPRLKSGATLCEVPTGLPICKRSTLDREARVERVERVEG